MLQLWRDMTGKAPKLPLGRLGVAVAIGLGLITLTSSPAFAFSKWGNGSVQCSFSARVTFSPPLTARGGGTNRSRISAALSVCTTTAADNLSAQITGANFKGFFAHSPLDCATLSTTGAPISGVAKWQGLYYVNRGWRKAPFHPSYVVNDDVTGTDSSFLGAASVVVNVPSTLASGCASKRGLRVAALSGTMTVGPSCGPGAGPITIHPIGPGPLCGAAYNPRSITAGPDGALWFTIQGGQYANGASISGVPASIVRMTTSGAVTIYSDPGMGPIDITAGPDGALWFTNGGSIGRITTSGVVTYYTGTGIAEPGNITAGPDGALWFTNIYTNSQGAYASASIGRITTSGVVSTYTDPNIYFPGDITSGSDGALWFTNLNGSIGRITTSGVVTHYAVPGTTVTSITSGPDGALWFVDGDASGSSIGRITTSGVVSTYTDPNINGPFAITSGSDGALWFTDYSFPFLGSSFGSIGRITTSGVVTDYTALGVYTPYDITSGPDGALWFVNLTNDSIGRITTPG
jgi:virginiamycin B lyase